MISAENRSNTAAMSHSVNGNANSTTGATASTGSAIPKCVCGWKNCRVYQKAFHSGRYEIWDGVIKLKFVKGDPESMALKSTIDRLLKVDATKRSDYKVVNNREVVRYTVARHHFTEKHLQKAQSTEGYSFLKPFTAQGAKKYLYSVDERDTLQNDHGDLFYVQAPNNTKEAVKAKFMEIKERLEKNGKSSNGRKEDPRDSEKDNRQSRDKNENHDEITVSTERSAKQQQELMLKEQENAKLKDQVEAMQAQLSFLHDMVKKLQEDNLEKQSVRSGGRSVRDGGSVRAKKRDDTHSRARRTVSGRSGRSGRSGVPHEIELGDEESGNERSETGDSQWNDWSAHGGQSAGDGDEATLATFRSKRRGGVQRRFSNSSAISRASRATSIVSASASVRRLPREIELDDDEEDSESHESLEEEAFDNRSMASNWRSAQYSDEDDDDDEVDHHEEKKGDMTSQDYDDLEGPSAMGGQRPSIGMGHRKPSRRSSNDDDASSRRSSLGSHLSKGDNKSDSKDANTDVSSLTAGTYQVQALVVTDPYGEQGTYTGSISNSTNMPHGYGRLEYDRAGRWYEGKFSDCLFVILICLLQ